MENHITKDVLKFLDNQYEYLTGDLDVFHKICQNAEAKESLSEGLPEPTQSLASPLNTTTTTIETTKYPNNNDKLYRLTIPVTLSLFSIIDSVGFLSGDNYNFRETGKNFKEFFKQSKRGISDKDLELIIYVFRQGLSHFYFPKLNLAISYHSTNQSRAIIFKDSNDYLTLNVNILERIVLDTFKTIKEDTELHNKMEQKYQNLISYYQKEDGLKISNYDSK